MTTLKMLKPAKKIWSQKQAITNFSISWQELPQRGNYSHWKEYQKNFNRFVWYNPKLDFLIVKPHFCHLKEICFAVRVIWLLFVVFTTKPLRSVPC
ncbi:MAG: hypothetical protein WBA41_33365 [Rivularia sp. (in: cyanobacteria)]